MIRLFFTTITLLTIFFNLALGQEKIASKFGNGIKVMANDSSFSMKFRARFQTLYAGTMDTGTEEYTDNFLIRRARLKFDGHAYTPRLKYKLELGLSNRDVGGSNLPQTNYASNIILDAVLKYNFYKNWTVWFGQTKLPGNMERVISSANLQLVDRSYLNSRYTLDRDAGIQLHYSSEFFRYKASISKGEGRNITASNQGGYDYTHRVEWLPFGRFAKKGDYSGADLQREENVKLMLGLTYDINDRATRARGQKGSFLSEQRTLKTWFADAHLKYKGFSTMVEYANKTTVDSPAIMENNGDFKESFFVGTGLNVQSGYLFNNNFEIAMRFTDVNPENVTQINRNRQYTLGASRYIAGHALKIQSDVTLIREATRADRYMYRLQVEFSL